MGFPAAYMLTLAVEVPAVVVVGVWLRLGSWPRILAAAVAANLVTVPLLWFVVAPVLEPRLGWLAAVLWGEALVVAAEAGIYAAWLRCRFLLALAISLAANGLSVLVGLAV